MTDFKTSFKAVKKLSGDFKANERIYLSPKYSEAEVRKDYIDKFFTALGWDVNHNIQKNPYEQEVKVEKTQRNQRRTDYAFFLLPNFKDPKFFVEAKKPQRNLRNADDYFQAIRYGWNANTPIAVLTDFEEFHILDCRFKPDINSVLQNKNHKQYHYTDYANSEKFQEIYFLFSHEAIAENSLEKYADSLPKPKGRAVRKGLPRIGYQTIDEDFLEYIDDTRETLAKAFKKNDISLTSEELTEATQRTIDRLVFIRFLEDKLIEPENYVTEFGNGGNSWNDFIAASRKLDSKYNGIVFKKHFIDEKNFKGPDDNEFDQICENISHLNSPYDFNAIPIHILGSIYERFLGKVVHATDKRVKVEEKPEVRKAGGVYYTPKYIVDYIVQNTVGKLINAKTPNEISKMHFADIACGSGSFLISVFECLLEYHNNYYQENRKQAKKDGCLEKDGAMVLSIIQKQKILQNNIYGVDIDQQATEVTQLSLALKMLEDETTATANDMQVLFHEKILPDLSKNIVCGNSLIGTDILSNNMFESEEERKLNPMDFGNVFPGIMNSGGFDAIVGNPPYLSMEDMASIHRNYYYEKIGNGRNRYFTAIHKSNLYAIFYEKAFLLAKQNGYVGLITPYSWLSNSSFINLRKLFISKANVQSLNIFPIGVFQQAGIATGIVIFIVNPSKKIKTVNVFDFRKYPVNELAEKLNTNKLINEIPISVFENSKDFVFNIQWKEGESSVYEKIEKDKLILDDFAFIDRGCDTANNKKYTGYDFKKTSNSKKLLSGDRFNRYQSEWNGLYLYYLPKQMKKEKETARPGEARRFESKEKIIVYRFLDSNKNLICTYDTEKYYCLGSCYVINPKDNISFDLKFILAILNSSLITFYNSKLFSGVKVTRTEMLRIPFPKINFQNKTEKTAHDKIVNLVIQLLESKKQLHTVRTDKDKSYYERKCTRLDRQIDSEVYKLYNLTEEEIKIVEGKE